MKTISYDTIIAQVRDLCIKAATRLPSDTRSAIQAAVRAEKSPLGKSILEKCLTNADIAAEQQVPICQDTGIAVFFVEMGTDVHIAGGSLKGAIQQGTKQGYKDGFLRNSIVSDPIFGRKNTGDNTPAIIYLSSVKGDSLKITLAPKGGGSENMSAIAMLKPSQGEEGVIDFVVRTVTRAGGNPCPPTVVGIGIGGTFEKAAFLAKKALIRELGQPNPDPNYADLENRILARLNDSGVGPQGLGGRATALAVHIEYHPCHIASLPVAVNLNCHAARHATILM
jgi:fumarate hydratase subunit alpha